MSGTGTTAAAQPERAATIALGGWSFYFIVKLLLFWRELTGFHPLENLAFAALLLVPLASPAARRLRALLAVPAAVALLYHDSWLPPFGRVLAQAGMLADFSLPYLLELAGRFLDWQTVALLALAWAAYRLAARALRVGFLVFAALLGLALAMEREPRADAAAEMAAGGTPARTSAAPADPEQALRAFHAAEAQRRVRFPAAGDPAAGNPVAGAGAPFDLVFIHVCSLSWADLRAAGLDTHPLWNEFDFLFRQFNTAASYSGPAAIRINRATCGQAPHGALYERADDQCYLLPNLQRAGFAPQLALNHDGHFDDFLPLLRAQGASAAPQPLAGVAAPLRAFDDSAVHDDLGMLSRWLERRGASAEPRVALFYNTISLHDGNRIVTGPDARLSSRDNYRPRAAKLLDDLAAFMEKIRASGRRAVVVVVPEHGAALHGDRFQIAGLREIPTPAITLVPVGVKVIGPDAARRGDGMRIDAPSSYLALSQLIARLIGTAPYGAGGFDPAAYAAGLPVTEYVAENDGVTMLQLDQRYWLRQGKDGWREYRPD